MQKPFSDHEKMKGICRKCPHRANCKKACEPVRQYLAHENRAVFEKTYTDEAGQKISIIYSRPKEINLSSFQREGDTDKNRANKIEMAFSTENDSAFAHFEPSLKQTKLFVDKFFFKLSIQDLAIKYDMTPEKVHEYYAQARKRVFAILEHLDAARPLKLEHYWKQIEARSDHLSRGRRYFILNKALGLLPVQISQLEGVSADSVSILINRVSDQLRAGEISLFDFTEQEAKEAKARLDSVRERRRKHRANNPEKMRKYEQNRNRKKSISK